MRRRSVQSRSPSYRARWLAQRGGRGGKSDTPRSGWLDGLGRLEGGRFNPLDVRRRAMRPSVASLEFSAGSIRALLFADVLADLLQFKTHGGDGVPGARKGSPVKFRSFPHNRATAIALFPFRNPITEATGCWGRIAMHVCTRSGIKCPSRIWHSFCRARAWKISPR